MGCAREILSDQGRNVHSKIMKEVCRVLGSHQSQTCGYHPEGNSITERENKVIVDMLSHYVSKRQDDWDEFLPVVMMAYRSSVHRTLGETPEAMVFGHEINLPLGLRRKPSTKCRSRPSMLSNWLTPCRMRTWLLGSD